MALGQLGRMIGSEVRDVLGVHDSAPFPDELAPEAYERIRALTAAHADPLSREFAAEASASDDVQDATGATAYLEDRLRFFGPLLSEETRQRIRRRYAVAVQQWTAAGGR
jgi:hypothetical protein